MRYQRNDPRQSNQKFQQNINDRIPQNKPGEAQGPYPSNPKGKNYPSNVKDFQQPKGVPNLPSDQNLNQYLPDPRQGMDTKQYPGNQNFGAFPPAQDPRKYPPRSDSNQNPSLQAPAPGQYQNPLNTNVDLERSRQSQYPPGPLSNIQANNMKESPGGKIGNQYPDNPPLPRTDGSNFYPPLKNNPSPPRQNPQNPPRPEQNQPMPPRVPPQNYQDLNVGQNMNPPNIINTQMPQSSVSKNDLPQKPSMPRDYSNKVPVVAVPIANQNFHEMAPGPNAALLDQASQSENVPFGANEQMPVVDPIQINQANIDRPLEAQMPRVDPIQSDRANNIPPNPVQVDKPDFDTDKKSRILGKISPKSNPPNSQNNVNPNGT